MVDQGIQDHLLAREAPARLAIGAQSGAAALSRPAAWRAWIQGVLGVADGPKLGQVSLRLATRPGALSLQAYASRADQGPV
jgi:hypothetical protein